MRKIRAVLFMISRVIRLNHTTYNIHDPKKYTCGSKSLHEKLALCIKSLLFYYYFFKIIHCIIIIKDRRYSATYAKRKGMYGSPR